MRTEKELILATKPFAREIRWKSWWHLFSTGLVLGAMYFGYDKITNPVRVGVIGTGDEGNVLISAINPEYVQVVAIADIRPSSIHRAFHGDWASDAALAALREMLVENRFGG